MHTFIQKKIKMVDHDQMDDHEKCIFVTVGTTSFDCLIEEVSSKNFCELCKRLGYSRLLLQIGRGVFEPQRYNSRNFKLEFYRYKDSIAKDISKASLVISHAGSGTVLETLRTGRPLIVVINELLMDNHQKELASQLEEDGHLFYATCSSLLETLEGKDLRSLKPFPPGKPEHFASYLDKVMGLRSG